MTAQVIWNQIVPAVYLLFVGLAVLILAPRKGKGY